jgi:hypothetical protein
VKNEYFNYVACFYILIISIFESSFIQSCETGKGIGTVKRVAKQHVYNSECHRNCIFMPMITLIVLCCAILYIAKWDSQEEGEVKTKYHVTWRGNLCKDEK